MGSATATALRIGFDSLAPRDGGKIAHEVGASVGPLTRQHARPPHVRWRVDRARSHCSTPSRTIAASQSQRASLESAVRHASRVTEPGCRRQRGHQSCRRGARPRARRSPQGRAAQSAQPLRLQPRTVRPAERRRRGATRCQTPRLEAARRPCRASWRRESAPGAHHAAARPPDEATESRRRPDRRAVAGPSAASIQAGWAFAAIGPGAAPANWMAIG